MGYLWVFIGGGLGSITRYTLAKSLNASGDYPWGTLLANGLSCLVLGILLAMVSKQWLSLELRLLLVTGFCGGFSTFSTFSYEILAFFKNAQYASAAIYLMGSVLIGLMTIWIGMKIID
jgi:CrcB protein